MLLADLVPSALSAELTHPGLLLLIWLHGFKGGDDTFGDFPDRLTFLLSETCSKTRCKSLVYPAYDTRGSLSKASEMFSDWLTVKTSEHEAVYAEELKDQGKGDGKREQAYIVLLGHSMGGLVIADATLKLIRDRQKQDVRADAILWPGIIGLIGYDTPYYGLHPAVFTNAANEYLNHAKNAQQLVSSLGLGLGFGAAGGAATAGPSEGGAKKKDRAEPAEEAPSRAASNWWKVGLAAASVAGLAAAAGTTYWQKDKIAENLGWATSHLDYVGELWKPDRLSQRMVALKNAEPAIEFHCFYTEIPKVESDSTASARQFIVLPSTKTMPVGIKSKFSANQNSRAANEITAHTTMFDQAANSGYWALGKESARLVAQWLAQAHVYRTEIERTNRRAGGEGGQTAAAEQTREALSESARARMKSELGERGLREEL